MIGDLTKKQTLMASEAQEAPDVVASQLANNGSLFAELTETLPREQIRLIMTCARGSSDHAASYGKYLIETELGIPVSSHPPSIASLYNVAMDLSGVLFIVISQSGKSPDLVANAKWAKANGAFVMAIVNVTDSPVAKAADMTFPLMAGAEKSVAATKSFIASLAALANLVASYAPDSNLASALPALPDHLRAAQGLDWSGAAPLLAANNDILTIGRGLSYGIAQEAALKMKETSAIHAEAFSSAEVRHGPLGLLRENLPFVIFSQNDACRADISGLANYLCTENARVFVADPDAPEAQRLPVLDDLHPALAPICSIASFYLMANAIALLRGHDPDQPPHLKKVTETV